MTRLEQRIEIAGTIDHVWSVLSDFGGVHRWAPYVRRSGIVSRTATGVGARRVLRHAWGFSLEEAIVSWADRRAYAFDVVRVPYPMTDVRETWAVEIASSHVAVTTTVAYRVRLGAVGKLLERLLIRRLVRREMRAGLRGLKRCVESYAGAPAQTASTSRVRKR